MISRFQALMFLSAFMINNSAFGEPATSKVSRQGPYEVKQLVTPSFDDLPLERKLFAYYLSRAMDAGNEIGWQQMGRDGLKVRRIMEQLWAKKHLLSPFEKAAVSQYYFEILSQQGIYDHRSNQKFTLKGLTEEQFADLLNRLEIEVAEPETLAKIIIDPAVKKYFHAPLEQDRIKASGANFHSDQINEGEYAASPKEQRDHNHAYPVVVEDADGRRRIESRVISTTGVFGKELSLIYERLEVAKTYARPDEKQVIEAYQRAMVTGDPKDYLEADRAWVRFKPQDIDFSFGFIETYNDPLGVVGTWQGSIVLLANDKESKRRSKAIQKAAPLYEQEMPVDPRFKKRGEFTPPQAEGADLLYWVGGGMAGGPRGFNLPNDSRIRAEEGSKSYTLFNKLFDVGGTGPEFDEKLLTKFYAPEYHSLLQRTGQLLPYKVHVDFHEVLGHGSGIDDPGVDSEKMLGEFFNQMEEGRAEIAAIYHMLDYESLVKRTISPPEMDTAQAADFAFSRAIQFFTDHLQLYSRFGGAEIRQAHQVGRQLMLNKAIRDGAIQIVMSKEGIPWIKIDSMEKLRKSLGGLWSTLQDLKGTGNKADLAKLISENWSLTREQVTWQTAITKGQEQLNLPKLVLYLNPTFQLVLDEKNTPQNVKLVYEPKGDNLDPALNYEARRLQRDCVEALVD